MVDMQELQALVVAVILGGAIGLERELSGKSAGLRTNIIICLGSAAFIIIARHFADEGTNLDSMARLAAGVVTGVGFLGAGVLIQEGGGVHGLTTAASIWLVTSIGMACGAGLYVMAIVITALALVVLLGLQPITSNIHKRRLQRQKEKARQQKDKEQT